MIKIEKGVRRYWDKNGVEITEGSKIKYQNGRIETVYLTNDGELGTDATNKKWIESGRAFPGEFGLYPITRDESEEVEVINE